MARITPNQDSGKLIALLRQEAPPRRFLPDPTETAERDRVAAAIRLVRAHPEAAVKIAVVTREEAERQVDDGYTSWR